MIQYEYRSTKIRQGPPKLTTHANLDLLRGFRSVYGWPDETAQHVISTGSTAGLKYFPVYSNELLLDFDDQPEAAAECEGWLLRNNHTHSMWESGGRSVHFHIRCCDMEGISVPYSQRMFVSTTFPKADLSFYHAAGMYRLPGTAHEKNPGRYKVMLSNHYGLPLDIPMLVRPPVFKQAVDSDSGGQDKEMLLTTMMFKVISEGEGRNHHAFKLAKVAQDCGYDYDRALEIVEAWSSTCAQPSLDAGELEATVRSAYRVQAHANLSRRHS